MPRKQRCNEGWDHTANARHGEILVPRGTMDARLHVEHSGLTGRRPGRFAKGQSDGSVVRSRLRAGNGLKKRFGASAPELGGGNPYGRERRQGVASERRVAEADNGELSWNRNAANRALAQRGQSCCFAAADDRRWDGMRFEQPIHRRPDAIRIAAGPFRDDEIRGGSFERACHALARARQAVRHDTESFVAQVKEKSTCELRPSSPPVVDPYPGTGLIIRDRHPTYTVLCACLDFRRGRREAQVKDGLDAARNKSSSL